MKAIRLGFALALLLAIPLAANAEGTGRTDGPEKSELGKGGYPFGGPSGRILVSPSFGSGFYEVPGSGSRTGLLYGLDLGYEMDEWIGLQGSYAYLTDRGMSLIGLGSRFTYRRLPFAYFVSVQAGLYVPRTGSRNFGLAPGAGVEIVLDDRFRVGLTYREDIIFSDQRTRLGRIAATLGIGF